MYNKQQQQQQPAQQSNSSSVDSPTTNTASPSSKPIAIQGGAPASPSSASSSPTSIDGSSRGLERATIAKVAEVIILSLSLFSHFSISLCVDITLIGLYSLPLKRLDLRMHWIHKCDFFYAKLASCKQTPLHGIF